MPKLLVESAMIGISASSLLGLYDVMQSIYNGMVVSVNVANKVLGLVTDKWRKNALASPAPP